MQVLKPHVASIPVATDPWRKGSGLGLCWGMCLRKICSRLLDPGGIVVEVHEARAQIVNDIRHLAGQGTQQERSTGF